jgi:ATP-binding cassette subfamily B protein
MITIPVIIIPIIFLGRITKKLSKTSQEKLGELTAISEETIYNFKTIQAYVQEEKERMKFKQKLQETINISLARIKMRSLLTFFVISGIFTSIIFILWIGGQNVITNKITPGELSSFIYLAVLCAASMGSLSEVINNFHKSAGVWDRIKNFLDIIPEIQDKNITEIQSQHSDNQIIMTDVIFYYPSKPNQPALHNLNIIFPQNKITALVGESGAGKSTIIQLLLRFYDIQKGKIYYNGQDIHHMTLQELRNNFAYVSQDTAIFSDTIYNNIIYGKPDATLDQVIDAAKKAAAFDFINLLPEKFNTFVGEKGVRLSGGQKQRIAIARAILKDPSVLLLDEATSSLDIENEMLVQEGINNLIQSRTSIIIAHRLSTIRSADKIICLKNGQVCEEGTHEKLLALQGYYFQLYKKYFTV